ncbi:SDR family oxidoreductase [Streptomyces platensis]|uniref:SDR family oxidoreductase n=1 Tax=Streptomyces platensis TaxID=58346 RepID=UPI0036B5EB31
MPYDQLFGPNVRGTAELIRLAVTSRIKQFTYLSTVAVVFGNESAADESADIRTACRTRGLEGDYADGYAASKWAGEVLLHEAHERFGLPVAVFRSNLILAHPRYRGQLNIRLHPPPAEPAGDRHRSRQLLRPRHGGRQRTLRRTPRGLHRAGDHLAG